MKRLFAICLVLSLLALSGCAFFGNDAEAGGESSTTSEIVGTWETIIPMDLGAGTLNYSFTVTYSLNGTGRETLSYAPLNWSMSVNFTWSASNGRVTITSEEDGVTTTTTVRYGVVGDALTTYARGTTRTLNRVR